MKSIQTKFIALILGCVLLSSAVIGGAGVLSAQKVVDQDAAQVMNLLCSEQAQGLNALLSRIEQSVQTLAIYTVGQLESTARLQEDPDYRARYTQSLQAVAVNAAENTEGAVSVYIRYAPQLTDASSGLFWSRGQGEEHFTAQPLTDLLRYDEEDTGHVGWNHLPVQEGGAVWMAPYENPTVNMKLISYVVPIYVEGQLVGVVGMDIDFALIAKTVAAMELYETGYAFLVDERGNVMYHEELPIGASMVAVDESLAPVIGALEKGSSERSLFAYKWRDVPKKMAFRSLSNGMRLAVTAPVAEIDAAKNQLIEQIGIAVVAISSLSVLATVLVARRIAKPLRELTAAAQKIAAGDLSTPIIHHTQDEVGVLADSFQQTVNHLQKYINYINGLAYQDSLTGMKNKTAYLDKVQQLEESIQAGGAQFAVGVFDINGLKLVNDTYGHDYGDMLLVECTRLICSAFKHSPVYRIGGDEFVVILERVDLENWEALLQVLTDQTAIRNQSTPPEYKVSIARGLSHYDPVQDVAYSTVFKRADEAMYRNKAAMKARAWAFGEVEEGPEALNP